MEEQCIVIQMLLCILCICNVYCVLSICGLCSFVFCVDQNVAQRFRIRIFHKLQSHNWCPQLKHREGKNSHLIVPPLASCSSPSSGSAEHFPRALEANLTPSFAKFPTCSVWKMIVWWKVPENNPTNKLRGMDGQLLLVKLYSRWIVPNGIYYIIYLYIH